MTNEKILKISILGYGGMAHYHFERLSKLGIAKITGVFDTDEKRQEAARKEGL